MDTPWGLADSVTHVADGIICVSTPSHGGYFVSGEAKAKLEERFPEFKPFAGRGWYEEDCDWTLVAVTFPEHFPVDGVRIAEQIIRSMGTSYPKWASVAEKLEVANVHV